MFGAAGAVVSTVIERLAGVASALPAASVAKTSNVCDPAASAAGVNGEVQGANAAASTRHWNVAPVGSLEENANVGVVSFVGLLGDVSIVVCGAVVSTVI